MEQPQGGLKQPALGIWGTIIVILLSITVAAWFKPETFGTWVTVLWIAGIPAQIMLALIWQTNYPAPGATLAQPLKGTYFLLLNIFFALIISIWIIRGIGGGNVALPMVAFFVILTVPIMLWCVAVFQCWPASAIKGHPAVVGLITLIICYIVSYIIYRIFFDFSFMSQAPFYPAIKHLDPKGAVMAAKALAFFVTTVAIILACILLDFWPLSAMIPKAPAMGKQPLFGIIAGIWVLIWSYIVWLIFVNGMGMDPMSFMIKISVCWIFGEFIMLVCMQTAPWQTTKQPGKGIAILICTVILGIIMWYLYAWFGTLLNGALPKGPPAFALELWVASAMLGVTFPMMNIYCIYFNYWPFTDPTPPPPPAA